MTANHIAPFGLPFGAFFVPFGEDSRLQSVCIGGIL